MKHPINGIRREISDQPAHHRTQNPGVVTVYMSQYGDLQALYKTFSALRLNDFLCFSSYYFNRSLH